MTKKLKNKVEEEKVNLSKMSREEKIQTLIDYAKDCYNLGNKPTKRSIRKKFNIEIYNYFENIGDYYKKAGIPLNIQDYPNEEAIKIIVDYVKDKAKYGIYLSKKDIETELRIHVDSYFRDLKDLYEKASIDYSLVEKSIMKKMTAAHTYNSEQIEKQKEAIRCFIRLNISKGFYPSIHHIQKNLNLAFYNLYDNIYEAYNDTNVQYSRPSPILLGKKKEEVFTLIIKDLFLRMDYKILRVSIESENDFNKYSDMTVIDKNGDKILVELKAYRKDYCITKREFEQLLKYMKNENISKGIFITTSNTKKCNFDNLEFINGDILLTLLRKYNLNEYLYAISWIQESRVNSKEKEKHYELMRNHILQFVRNQKEIPSSGEIEKMFKIDLRTYFGEKNPYKKIKEITKKYFQ